MEATLPRTGVLVVLHADGFVEVFADETVQVIVANRLHSEHDTGRMSTGIDAVLERGLPWAFRDLYYPCNCRAVGRIERITPEQALRTRYLLGLLQVIRQDARALEPVAPAGPCEVIGTGRAWRRNQWNESNESDELEAMR
jgi:hypothetical protein